METNTSSTTGRSRRPWTKLVALALLVAAGGTAYSLFGDSLSIASLAEKESVVRQYQVEQPAIFYGVAFLTYVLITGLSLPGAAPLTLIYGWFFGFWTGLVLVSFASTTGATVAFLLSRYLARQWIQNRFGERLASFNQALDREGAFYLFMLRLIPAVPFFVINVVMGLTRIPIRTFWWVSQVGMVAGTCVFVYAGASVPDLDTLAEQGASGVLSPQLIVAFVILGVFPLALKKIAGRLRSRTPGTPEGSSPSSATDVSLAASPEPTSTARN